MQVKGPRGALVAVREQDRPQRHRGLPGHSPGPRERGGLQAAQQGGCEASSRAGYRQRRVSHERDSSALGISSWVREARAVRTFKGKASPVAFCRQATISGMGPTAVRTTPSDRLHRAEAASTRRQGRRQAAGLPVGHTQPHATPLLSGGRLPFLPLGSHTREQEPELLLWVPLGNGLWCQKGERFWSPCAPGFFRLYLRVLTKVTAGQVHTLTVPTSKRPHTARCFCHPLGGKTNYLWTWMCPSYCEYPHICCRNATVGTQRGAHISPGELDSERRRLCSPGATQSIPRPGVRVGRGLRTVGGDLWQVSSQRGG